MENASIKKVKIKNEYFLEVEYSVHDGDNGRNVKEDRTQPVHDDLRRLFRQLHIHLGLIAEQVKDTGKGITADFDEDNAKRKLLDPSNDFKFSKDDWAILDNILCTGFSIGGSGESEGVTLIGRREMSTGSILNLVSPFAKWEGDYDYASELATIIEALKAEVSLYLFEGKHQPDAQMSLPFGEEVDELASEADDVTVSFNGGPEMSMKQFEKATKGAVSKAGKRNAQQQSDENAF